MKLSSGNGRFEMSNFDTYFSATVQVSDLRRFVSLDLNQVSMDVKSPNCTESTPVGEKGRWEAYKSFIL